MITTAFCALLAIGNPANEWWSAEVSENLSKAPARLAEWTQMLEKAPESQREGYAYLMRWMPERDLENLPVDQLVENVSLAYQAREMVPWGDDIPDDIFYDSVLPYMNATENRDPWRKDFFIQYMPKIKDAKTPGEAALILNSQVFVETGVHYNTKRVRPDQSPKETLEQKMATCTGLSIMLADLCRAVCVPARIAGIPSWPGRGGNHTWTEVWDDGWHFVGAAEPDKKGLNHAWFVGDAAKAIEGSKYNAIYAVSYKETGTLWPMGFGRNATGINAVDVSARYAGPAKAAKARLMIDVRLDGVKTVADVVVQDLGDPGLNWSGESFGPTSDINYHLSFPIAGKKTVLIKATKDGKAATAVAEFDGENDKILRITLGESKLEDVQVADLLAARLGFDPAKSEGASQALKSVTLTEKMKQQAWTAVKDSPASQFSKRNFDEDKVASEDRESPYLVREVGEKPADGWGLYIAMHGGGSVPKAMHDRAWKGFFQRYREHPEAGGYLYMSLRAPNDTWNGFYDDAICPMIDNLVKQMIVHADVNPDKVAIMGYSHGGYGAFVIGPKMPWRFAAVHSSAAAPTDGETEAINLMNTYFTYMIGEKDTAYGRMARCTAFEKLVADLTAKHGWNAENRREYKPGLSHGVLPDQDKAADMVPQRRNAWPKKMIWRQTDERLTRFFWIETPQPKTGSEVSVEVKGQKIVVDSDHEEVVLWLSDKLLDVSKTVMVEFNGKEKAFKMTPSLENYIESLNETADRTLASGYKIVLR
jgi:hypothetical protein